MALGDVYQLIDEQELFGQTVLNVYFYKDNNALITGSVSHALCDSFIATVLPGILPLQTPDILHKSIAAKNLFAPSDAYTELISEAGTAGASDTEPGFTAVGFKLEGDNAAVRPGSKRYAAIDDAASTDGVITNTAYIALLVAMEALLTGSLDTGALTAAFVPVIVKRILGGGEYRLPDNSGEAVLSNIIGALFNSELTSQVSRKVGRGE